MRTPIPSPASVGISQDNIIFGMLVLAFVIYITMHNELKIYLGFFAPSKAPATSTAPAATVSPNATPADPTQFNPNSGAAGSFLSMFGSAGNWLSNFGTFLAHPFSGVQSSSPSSSTSTLNPQNALAVQQASEQIGVQSGPSQGNSGASAY